ncbi:hypothetical protein ASD15_01005 [Massilia sp. Root351]|uniref:CHAD domain-containing protein n=1 Tax=Massilia sp. Root351 TaxID=1736522 RepID=UPI00070941D3|nr:CHAD domain-containing protein [Massilia sp. Root351]KQV90691.1 hypothetical protein ASD15_01005 [Massilia sp. Root351]
MNAHLDLAEQPTIAEVHRAEADTAAVRAAPLTLNRQLSAEQAFRRIAANCREQIAANHAAVARGNAPEALHQMRVGLRRLRSALALYAPLLELPAALRSDLRWLGEQLGAARDWDVLASSTLPRVAEGLPDDMELVLVRLAAESRANDLRAAAADAVSTERYAELMRNLGGWLHDAAWRSHCTGRQRQALSQSALGFADEALAQSRARLLKRGRKLRLSGAHRGAKARHRVRIAAKRARYAAEFFQSLYPKRQVRPYIGSLAKLQDELGWLNDTAVADGLLKKLQHGEARLDGSAAFTRGYLASTTHGGKGKLRKLWRRVRQARAPA